MSNKTERAFTAGLFHKWPQWSRLAQAEARNLIQISCRDDFLFIFQVISSELDWNWSGFEANHATMGCWYCRRQFSCYNINCYSRFLLMHCLRGSSDSLSNWVPITHMEGPKQSSVFLTLAWPTPDHCWHLGRDQIDAGFVSQINK